MKHTPLNSALPLLALALCVATPSVAQIRFTDVTAAAGVDHVQFQLPEPPQLREALYESGGACAADFDGDGLIDLFATRLDGPDLLYRNQGDGTFRDVAEAAGLGRDLPTNGCVAGDIDNDGDQDLFVTTILHPRFYLYLNNGQGQFREEGAMRGLALEVEGLDHYGFSATLGDVDNDGYLDLFTTEWTPQVVLPGQAPPHNARLLRNLGAEGPGFFQDITREAGLWIDPALGGIPGVFSFTARLVDFDGDGLVDIAVAGDFGTSRLFWNNGDLTFTDGTELAGVGTDENGMGAAIGDYDGDGHLDWFVTSIHDPAETCEGEGVRCFWGYTGNRLYRYEGARRFSDQTDAAGVRAGFWGWGAEFFDADNDGDLDLTMTNGFSVPIHEVDAAWNNDPMRFWRNEGPERPMTEISEVAGLVANGSGKGLLTFDYDRDGDLDLFIVHNAGQPVLFRNDSAPGHGFIRVKVRGTVSNLDGIGARVMLAEEGSERWQVRAMEAGSNFLAQSEGLAHFGLGPVAPNDPRRWRVRVEWPASGRVLERSGVEAGSLLEMVEPDTSAPCGLSQALRCVRPEIQRRTGLPGPVRSDRLRPRPTWRPQAPWRPRPLP